MPKRANKSQYFLSTIIRHAPKIFYCFLIAVILLLYLPAARAEDTPKNDSTQLEDILVTATKMETEVDKTPTNINVITRKEIEKYAARDITDLLTQIPGMTVWGQGYGSPSIGFYGARGNEPSMWGVKLMVNGIDWNAGNGSFNPTNVPINDIERVEIIKTPSAMYGDQASGGVINIITRVSDQPLEAKGGIAFGSYGTEQFYSVVNGKTKKVEYFVDASLTRTDGYQRDAWEDDTRFYTRLSYLIDDTSSITLHGSMVDGKGYYPHGITKEQFDDDPRYTPPGRGDLNFELWNTALVYKKTFGNFDFQSKVTVIGSADQYVYGSYNDSDEFTLWPEVGITWRKDFGRLKNKFNFGGEYRYYNRNSTKQAIVNDVIGAYTSSYHRKDGAWGLYAQDEIQITDKFTVTGGIRYDAYNSTCEDYYTASGNYDIDDSAVSPMIGATYNFSEAIGLFAGVNSGFRSFVRGMSASAVTANLKPERVYSYEVGLRGRPLPFLDYNFALFLVDTTDKIIRIKEIPATYDNAGKTRSTGLELGVNLNFQNGFYGGLNYTYQHSKYLDYVVSGVSYDGNRLPHVPEHVFGFSAGYSHEVYGNICFYSNYSSEKYFDSANEVDWEGYWLHNIKYTKRFTQWNPNVEFFVAGENLADKQYVTYSFGGVTNGQEWYTLYPCRGRSITAGVSLHFR